MTRVGIRRSEFAWWITQRWLAVEYWFSHREWHFPCLSGFGVAACDIYLVNPLPLQVCNFCRKKGATVGCEKPACRRSYHFFCALCDDAAVETDQAKGIYRYCTAPVSPGCHCQQEGPHWVGLRGLLGRERSSPLLKWCLIPCLQTVGEMFHRKTSLQLEGICLVLEPVTSLRGNKGKTERVSLYWLYN